MEATKRINIAIDETLHKELKIAAAVNGTTLKGNHKTWEKTLIKSKLF